jgi:hypothetical protein
VITMADQPAPGQDEHGGLTPGEDWVLTIWLWLAQASPAQLRQLAELTGADPG